MASSSSWLPLSNTRLPSSSRMENKRAPKVTRLPTLESGTEMFRRCTSAGALFFSAATPDKRFLSVSLSRVSPSLAMTMSVWPLRSYKAMPSGW